MKKTLLNTIYNKNGITLIALVITIVILVIIGGVAVGLTIGENGIINRAKQAAMMQKKAQYFEEINIEIVSEQMDRQEEAKADAFIVSLNERLTGQKQASNQSVSTYSKKSWIDRTIMCDSEKNINQNPFDNNMLIVYTVDGYELCILVDNDSLSASIKEDSFKQEENKCNVTYDPNGGTGTVDSQTVDPGFKVSLKHNNYTKDKYTFVGWCLNQNGSGGTYLEGTELRITEDTTLYAIWSLNYVTITYDANTGSGEMEASEVLIGEENQLPQNTFTKSSYVFSKWTTNADGTGSEYANNGNITIEENITLYAQWNPEVFAITYSLDGGSILGQKTTYTIEDEAFTLPTPTRDGFNFTGWTGTGLESATMSVTVPKGSTGARVYTANWLTTFTSLTLNYESNQVKTFTVPKTGTYKLEVWGAQGGTTTRSARGGYGGYSCGNIELTYNTVLYICIGEQGKANSSNIGGAGGYNGGGAAGNAHRTVYIGGAGGGGATHIAIGDNLGELRNYNENRNDIIMVAGGGRRRFRNIYRRIWWWNRRTEC